MTFRYGNILRKKRRALGRAPRHLVQFLHYTGRPHGVPMGGEWFLGMTVRDETGRLGGSRVGTIETFDVGGWVLDD